MTRRQIGGLVAGAVMLSLIAATPAAADTHIDQAPNAKIQYDNLDLTTPEGKAKLRTKVQRAALEVCQNDGALNDLDRLTVQRNCMKKALASSEVQMTSAGRAAETNSRFAYLNRVDLH
jgi:UrcA family protein